MLAKVRNCLLMGTICTGLVTLASPALAGCEPGKVAQKYPELAGKPLRIGTTGDSPPFNYRDPKNFDTVIGFNADLMRAVGKCIGVPVEFSVSDFAGLTPGVQSGHIDIGVSTIQYVPARAQQVNFIVYMNGTAGVVLKKDSNRKVESFADLCGLKGAATVGGAQIDILQQVNKTTCSSKPIDVTATPGGPGGPLLVHNDRVDFYLGPATIQSFDASLFRIAYTYATDNKIGAILKKGNDQLAQAALDSIQALQADGTEAKLAQTYLLDRAMSAPAELRKQ